MVSLLRQEKPIVVNTIQCEMKHHLLKQILMVCCGLLFLLEAQASSSRLFTSDKLSSTTIGFILQDHHGYIWVATQYGLNRCDGYRFTQY